MGIVIRIRDSRATEGRIVVIDQDKLALFLTLVVALIEDMPFLVVNLQVMFSAGYMGHNVVISCLTSAFLLGVKFAAMRPMKRICTTLFVMQEALKLCDPAVVAEVMEKCEEVYAQIDAPDFKFGASSSAAGAADGN